MMADIDRARAILSSLSEIGVRISVDDFWTEYSSVPLLTTFPINELKIDKTYVTTMLRDTDKKTNLIIVEAAINLAKALGYKIVAEGVEDTDTLDKLEQLGCDIIQGFVVSPPLPVAQFDSWLATTRWAPSPVQPSFRLRFRSTSNGPTA